MENHERQLTAYLTHNQKRERLLMYGKAVGVGTDEESAIQDALRQLSPFADATPACECEGSEGGS